MARALKFIDIGVNLTDSMFRGIYNGKQAHKSDLDLVLKRSFDVGMEKMMITGTSMSDIEEAAELAKTSDKLFYTVGIHPTRANELKDEQQSWTQLTKLLKEGMQTKKVVAIGEFGLDYERTQFCDKDTQKKYFEKQFDLLDIAQLPLFLHMRDACSDFVEIVGKQRKRFENGVVHSFTGSEEDALAILKLDLYIGINGCSLKTEQNLAVLKHIPIERLMIETDAPWCDIRNTHAGISFVKTKFESVDKKKFVDGKMVKGRNEPAHIIQVLEIIAAVKQMSTFDLAEKVYSNTTKVFFAKH